MALVKFGLSLVLFYLLNGNKDYWYPLISWLVELGVIACVAWFLARRITRDFLCKKIIPRISPNGKAVLVTGCDSGFGHMTALELNRMGFFVFAGCLNANGSGAKDLQKLASSPNRLAILQMDVTSREDISLAYEEVKQLLSLRKIGENNLFAVINNAGVTSACPIEWGKPDSIELYERLINVNTFGTIRVTKKFIPLLRKSKGRIINMSSIAAHSNMIGLNQYSVSKAATSKFTEGLQEELAQFGITSIEISPWFHRTPLLNPLLIVKTAFRNFEESSEEVKGAYGSSCLQNISKRIAFFTGDRRIVIQFPQNVVKVIVDALTSAEPDLVYRVFYVPFTRSIFWFLNDFPPWEITLRLRKLFYLTIDSLKVTVKFQIDKNKNIN